MQILKTTKAPGLPLEVDGTRYTIEFPLPAVIRAEEKLGRSLKSPSDWFGAQAKDIPALLEAGLFRHHPNVTPEDIAAICNTLGPEAYAEVAEALGTLAFPRWTARYKETVEQLQAAAVKEATHAV